MPRRAWPPFKATCEATNLQPNIKATFRIWSQSVGPGMNLPLALAQLACYGDPNRRSEHLVSHDTARTDAPPKQTTLRHPPTVVHQSNAIKGARRVGCQRGGEMQPPSNPQPKSQGEFWCRTWSKNVALRRAGSWVRIRVRPCVNHRGRRKSEVAVRRETALHPLEPQSQSCCGRRSC